MGKIITIRVPELEARKLKKILRKRGAPSQTQILLQGLRLILSEMAGGKV